MAEYIITNVGANKCLNVDGDNVTVLSAHKNVSLWSNSGTNEQRWIISNLGYNTFIKSKINLGFGLNVYRVGNPYNCDLFEIVGNETDALVNIVPDGDAYLIQLANYPTLYLTTNGTNVYWSDQYITSNYRRWTFNEVAVPEYHVIQNYPYILNQYHKDNLAVIRGYGCCACCCCNVANYYKKKKTPGSVPYTLDDLGGAPYYAINYQTGEAYFDNYPYVAFSYSFTTNLDEIFTILRSEIAADRPVLLKMDKIHKTDPTENTTHWVVAYAYVAKGNDLANILVMDPFKDEPTAIYGDSKRLSEALVFSDYTATLSRIEPTSAKV